MDMIAAEHAFITTLSAEEALFSALELLRQRGFNVDRAVQGTALENNPEVLLVRRGLSKPQRACTIAQYPQQIRLEWDRGRVSVGLLLEPYRVNRVRHGHCADILIAIANALELRLKIDGVALPEALLEWDKVERPLVAKDQQRNHRNKIIGAVFFTMIALFIIYLVWTAAHR